MAKHSPLMDLSAKGLAGSLDHPVEFYFLSIYKCWCNKITFTEDVAQHFLCFLRLINLRLKNYLPFALLLSHINDLCLATKQRARMTEASWTLKTYQEWNVDNAVSSRSRYSDIYHIQCRIDLKYRGDKWDSGRKSKVTMCPIFCHNHNLIKVYVPRNSYFIAGASISSFWTTMMKANKLETSLRAGF